MRDLATYQANFIEESNFRAVFLRLHKTVLDCKAKMNKSIK